MNLDTIEDALEFIKTCSIRNIRFKDMPPIVWKDWHERVYLFKNSYPTKDDLSILRYALDELNDGHSGIPNNESTQSLRQSPEMPFGVMIGKTAYIRLPSYNGGAYYSSEDLIADPYVLSAQNILNNLDRTDVDGWIVDLRTNLGGNYLPMLEGIGPLLGNGVHAYLLYPHLNIESPCSVDMPISLKHAHKPIAVLSGNSTSSSGELILISFKKLGNALIFGESSGGNSSSNIDFIFKARPVAITAGLMGDRDKNSYGDKIDPDIHFANGSKPEEIKLENYDPSVDPLVLHASKWISQSLKSRLSFSSPSAGLINNPPNFSPR